MNIEIKRKTVIITIGENEYRIGEKDGNLIINKDSLKGSSSLLIKPMYSNEIEIN